MIFAKEIKKLEDEIKFLTHFRDKRLIEVRVKLETLKKASKKLEEVIIHFETGKYLDEREFIDKENLLKQLEEVELQ